MICYYLGEFKNEFALNLFDISSFEYSKWLTINFMGESSKLNSWPFFCLW